MTTISMDKKYRTRDGREVRIYATDGGDAEPVHGAVRKPDGTWDPQAWRRDGRYFPDREALHDLIEVRPRIKGWVNLYNTPSQGYYLASGLYHSKEKADRSSHGRIACVPIEFTEGEGL